MKLILLIASILIFSLASCAVFEAKKQLARTVAPEDLALELEIFATCQEFKDRILPSVWISKHQLCLPLQFNVSQNPDDDNLKSHYFCTNIDHGRSIVHFVEIFDGDDETIQFPSFVLSLVPTNPFRILTKRTTVSRRPNCFITNDYCNGTNAIVNSCRSNPVLFKKGYIVSHDRIYITANQQESRDCRTSETVCCAYIAPLTFGGICENVASTDVLSFPKKHHDDHKHDDHKHDDNKHDDDKHDDYKHDDNKHDDHKHDDDKHDNNDHHWNHDGNNDHDNNDHQWNNNQGHGKPQHVKPQHGKPQHVKPQHGKEESSNDQEDDAEDK